MHFGDGDDPTSLGGRLRRRAGEVRAALLLEEAGEIEEAARVFEQVGAHGQAAALRLEHARTQRDLDGRLAVLREACARARGDGPQVRDLFRAYGEACLEAARTAPPQGRADHVLEAARALERGGEPEAAGSLFERIGRHADAARCFEAAGDIERMELALLAADRRKARRERARRTLDRVRSLWAAGARTDARRLLDGIDPSTLTTEARGQVSRIMEAYAQHGTRAPLLRLAWNGTPFDLVVARGTLVGRGTAAHVRIPDPSVSREHARIVWTAKAPALVDLGTRTGTFVDGRPAAPGVEVPVGAGAELAFGLAPPVTVVFADPPAGVLRLEGPGLPRPVLLAMPGAVVPLAEGAGRVVFRPHVDGPVRIEAADDETNLRLHGRGPAVRAVDLLLGDRIEVRGPGADGILEVRA